MSPLYHVARLLVRTRYEVLYCTVLLRVYGVRDTPYEVRANWTVLLYTVLRAHLL